MSVMKACLVGALVASVSVQSGCSFLFVSGPPADHANLASFECSESNAVPVLDTIWAGLNGLGAISVAGDNTVANQSQIVAVGLTWLAVSGAAAIYGYTKVAQCKSARHQREERYANGGPPPMYQLVPVAPGPMAAPPPAPPPAQTSAAPPPAAMAPPAAPPPLPATSAAPGNTPSAPTSSLDPARTVRPTRRSLAMRSALATE